MAWTTVAESNDALVNRLAHLQIIKSAPIEGAFRITDRGEFIGEKSQQAYSDRPYKNHLVHLSAPHMYVTILEALDIQPGQSFLNIGSGSGYLSCLASCLLGECGLSHGIEIKPELVEHSRNACRKWFTNILERRVQGEHDLPAVSEEGVSFAQGSCFDIDITAATATCRYDRIYIGAGCPARHIGFFISLLADDGILVVPIDERNELVRIRRILGDVYTTTNLSSVHYAPLLGIPYRQLSSTSTSFQLAHSDLFDSSSNIDHVEDAADDEEAEEEESTMEEDDDDVSAALPAALEEEEAGEASQMDEIDDDAEDPVSTSPHVPAPTMVRLPPVLWAPTKSRHKQFPTSFRAAVRSILWITRFGMAASGSDTNGGGSGSSSHCSQPSGLPTDDAALVPCKCAMDMHLWQRVLGYAARDWFVPVLTNTALLSKEVFVERNMRHSAEKSARQLNRQLRQVQRERDMYKSMVSRLQARATLAEAAGGSGGASAVLNTLAQLVQANGAMEEEEEEEEDEEEDEEEEDEEEEDEDDGEEEEEEEAYTGLSVIPVALVSTAAQPSVPSSAITTQESTTAQESVTNGAYSSDVDEDEMSASRHSICRDLSPSSSGNYSGRGTMMQSSPEELRSTKQMLSTFAHPPPFGWASFHAQPDSHSDPGGSSAHSGKASPFFPEPKKPRKNSMDMDTDQERDSLGNDTSFELDMGSWSAHTPHLQQQGLLPAPRSHNKTGQPSRPHDSPSGSNGRVHGDYADDESSDDAYESAFSDFESMSEKTRSPGKAKRSCNGEVRGENNPDAGTTPTLAAPTQAK